VRGSILRITCNWEDTEDVLQETYLNSYLHLDQFDGRSKFSTWLVRIAINSSLMLLRNGRRRRAVMVENSDLNTSTFDFPDKREDIESHHIRGQHIEHLWRAVRKLKAPLRQILELRYERELSVENIAAMTSLSVAAVKSRLLRARMHLRDSLSRKRNTAHSAVRSALNT
jgi:RNA polymerase sigma-70 factor (ECF subfamily)